MVIDTGVFIEHLRAKDKSKTSLYLIPEHHQLFISSVSLYELQMGATTKEKENDVRLITGDLEVLSFTDVVANSAAQIYHELRRSKNILGELRV